MIECLINLICHAYGILCFLSLFFYKHFIPMGLQIANPDMDDIFIVTITKNELNPFRDEIRFLFLAALFMLRVNNLVLRIIKNACFSNNHISEVSAQFVWSTKINSFS